MLRRSIGIALVLTVVGCSGNETTPGTSAPANKPFAIGMVTFAGYAPLYLAREKGFFGPLDVQLRRIEEVPSIRAAVSRGDLDAYLATPDIAFNIASQPPGKAIWAVDESAGGDGVAVGPGIRDLTDLKGKEIAVEPGLPPHFVLMYLLHQNGMSIRDVQLKDMSTQNAAAAFVGSSVDAAGLYEPYLSTSTKRRQGSRVVVSSAQVPGLIVDLIFASDASIRDRPNDVRRIIDGWRRAIAFIGTNRDEAFAIMAKAFNLSVPEFTDIVGGIRWLDLTENQELFEGGTVDSKLARSMSTVVEVLQRHYPETFKTEPKTVIDSSFVANPNPGAATINVPGDGATPDKPQRARWVHP
jgi:NitT/TauT family transport system substrate-binding protein